MISFWRRRSKVNREACTDQVGGVKLPTASRLSQSFPLHAFWQDGRCVHGVKALPSLAATEPGRGSGLIFYSFRKRNSKRARIWEPGSRNEVGALILLWVTSMNCRALLSVHFNHDSCIRATCATSGSFFISSHQQFSSQLLVVIPPVPSSTDYSKSPGLITRQQMHSK